MLLAIGGYLVAPLTELTPAFPPLVLVFVRPRNNPQKPEASRDGGQKEEEEEQNQSGSDDNDWSERRRLVEEWEDYDEVDFWGRAV